MANATAPVKSLSRVDTTQRIDKFDCAAAQNFYQGQQVGVNAAGLLVSTGFLAVIGRACRTLLASTTADALEVEEGILWFPFTGTLTVANRGDIVYSADNQTLTMTASTNPPAGYVYEVSTANDPQGVGAWVTMTFEDASNIQGIIAALAT